MSLAQRLVALAIPALLLGACLPYTVASTARTVAPDRKTVTGSIYFIPNAVNREGDSAAVPLRGFDGEARYGIDERSDWGVRIPMGSGVVLSYKRQLGDLSTKRTAVAVEGASGLVNFGEHLMVGGTLIVSAPESPRVTPYGGVRLMQVVPLSSGAVHDTPTVGGFFGARIGSVERGVSPELGVFYDRSALDLRRGSLLLVPSVSVHGKELLDTIRGIGRFF